MEGMLFVLSILYLIVSFVILIRWWCMTEDVKLLRREVFPDDRDLGMLIASCDDRLDVYIIRRLGERLLKIYNDYQGVLPNDDIKKDMQKVMDSIAPLVKARRVDLPPEMRSPEAYLEYLDSVHRWL